MKLVVLGGGESGVGAAILGKRLGYDVWLSDKNGLTEKYRQILFDQGLAFEEGGHTEDRILSADLVVKSPGIPDTIPLIQQLRAQGTEVISEIEFAGRHTDAKFICITGSNGKTTTTLLTYHILQQAGLDVGLAGNVGRSLAAQVAEQAHRIYVVELSSFQLDGMFDFRADVGILTNITPDHLDRYAYQFENYVDSKFRILNNMKAENLLIYQEDCEVVREKMWSKKREPQLAGFTYGSVKESDNSHIAAWMEGDELVACLHGKMFRIAKDQISIKGRHNVYNAMAAILACLQLEVAPKEIAKALQSFPQVQHRLETVCTKNGITYINDSKATNVDSAWYALDSMTAPVVWIAGGTDKGNDYSVLLDLVRKKVKVLICMGVDNQKLIANFSPYCPVVDTNSLAAAMQAVQDYAEPGDTVLLSPCCASFDLFKNYENRGELFKEAVKSLSQKK